MPVHVRLAAALDLPRAAAVLGEAFSDYAWTRWTVPADEHVQRIEALQTIYLERLALPYGAIWVDEGLHAVAAFLPPDAPAPSDDTLARVIELHGDRAPRLGTADALTSAYHDPAAWSLATVGVSPAQQGRGLGSAVCRAGLDRLDELGKPCGLDTSDPRNVQLYERLGFRTVARTPMPDDGPTVWTMHRDPR